MTAFDFLTDSFYLRPRTYQSYSKVWMGEETQHIYSIENIQIQDVQFDDIPC